MDQDNILDTEEKKGMRGKKEKRRLREIIVLES